MIEALHGAVNGLAHLDRSAGRRRARERITLLSIAPATYASPSQTLRARGEALHGRLLRWAQQ